MGPTPFLYDVRKGAQLFVENFEILKRLYLRNRKSYRLKPGTVGKLDPKLCRTDVGSKSLGRTVLEIFGVKVFPLKRMVGPARGRISGREGRRELGWVSLERAWLK